MVAWVVLRYYDKNDGNQDMMLVIIWSPNLVKRLLRTNKTTIIAKISEFSMSFIKTNQSMYN